MEPRFRFPAFSFLAGLLVWGVGLALHETADAPTLLTATLFCLAAGLLIDVSAVRCRQVGGPRYGGAVRGGVLLVLAGFMLWRMGVLPAVVLVAAAVVSLIVALLKEVPYEEAPDA